jgi:hypothetical protein
MSEIYVVWAKDADKAQARLIQITRGVTYRMLRRGNFALIQAEDIDNEKSLTSNDSCYCIAFEV